MLYKILVSLLVLSCLGFGSNAQNISTVAGGGSTGLGDGGPATMATLNLPVDAVVDVYGNLYIPDLQDNLVRKVTASTGIITTLAGTGVPGFGGDGGPATLAQLQGPSSVAVDSIGNIYIADQRNNRIRKVTPVGVISTVVGTGVSGYSGDGGPATAAEINTPTCVYIDKHNELYIADCYNHRVRKINALGIIYTVVGNGISGFSGDGGNATSAKLNGPVGVTKDTAGNFYIADLANGRIRKVSVSDTISTIAGNGTTIYSGDRGPATAAGFCSVESIAVDKFGNVYIANQCEFRIRKISPSGIISTFAGVGTLGFSGDGGPAVAAHLFDPWGVATDTMGGVYISDYGNHRIRYVPYCPLPVAGIINGSDTLCVGGSITLSNSMGGGTWISTNPSTATISTTGTVVCLSVGVTNIKYVVTNSCGSDTAIFPIVVRPAGSCTLKINKIGNSNASFNIYPNPGQGYFTLILQSNEIEEVHVSFTNMLGEIVYELDMNTNTPKEIKPDINAGIYYISTHTKYENLSAKLVVE